MKEKTKKILKNVGLSIGSLAAGIGGTLISLKIYNRNRVNMTQSEFNNIIDKVESNTECNYVDWMIEKCANGKGIIAGCEEIDETNGSVLKEQWIIGELVDSLPKDLPNYTEK